VSVVGLVARVVPWVDRYRRSQCADAPIKTGSETRDDETGDAKPICGRHVVGNTN
jgi:hypothetical protein